MLVPINYSFRSLFVRRSATLLTVFGIAATVAVLAGVLALQQGFVTLFSGSGREDVVVFLRPGANAEGESQFARDKAQIVVKGTPEIALDDEGRPMASMECYLAVRLERIGGGETNVPVRGVEPMSYAVQGDHVRLVDGRWPQPGADEVAVGAKLVDRILNCRMGDVVQLNLSPMRVVGVFESDGPYASEIWGDNDRILEALERPNPNRVIARVAPGTDVAALAERLKSDPQAPAKVQTEREYLTNQTGALSSFLLFLGSFMALVMGTAAVFTATNTMLSAVSARTHEIGILLSVGYRPGPIFLAFLLEALVLGLLGGVAGCLLVLPVNGIETGTTNFNTFTEIGFAFRI
ncbi:MAG: ABC transporter permease, partial [Planctomycetes bacterium]|nr:ABC transporter permease [Planctomycetota bacterium]